MNAESTLLFNVANISPLICFPVNPSYIAFTTSTTAFFAAAINVGAFDAIVLPKLIISFTIPLTAVGKTVDINLGSAFIRELIIELAAFINFGNISEISDGISLAMIGASPSIKSPTPERADFIAGIIFFANVLTESTRFLTHRSKLLPPFIKAGIKFPHADFIDAREPLIV